jgi:hypothetical protein
MVPLPRHHPVPRATAVIKIVKQEENAGKLIVVILPDTAKRNISTVLFD